MAHVHVRPYMEADWSRVNEIHDKARKLELQAAGLEAAYLSLEQAYENEGLFDSDVNVAVYDGLAVGFIAHTHDSIDWLYVDPDYHRRGIAKALIRHALAVSSEHVTVEVLCGNTAAISLYEACGFKTVEIRHGRMTGNESFAASGHIMVYQNRG